MSNFGNVKIWDTQNDVAQVTPAGDLCVQIPTRVAGQTMGGIQFDPNFWTSTSTSGGTATQANGVQTLATNTTANGAIQVISTSVARFVGQSENQYVSQIAMGDTGTTNNTRRWGAFNGTDGCYFKLSGTTLSACTMKGGAETATVITPAITLTDYNTYKIEYRVKKVLFYIAGILVYTSTNTGTWSNTLNLPVWYDNVNSGGSTANVSMFLTTATIYRLGPFETQPKYFHGTGATTSVLKYSAGTLHRIVINTTPSSGSNTITVYDNTAGSGNIIAVLTGGTGNPAFSLEYQVCFNTGLTIVTSGTGWDFTVIYQ